jgi:formylglycine-generating enzyme required for sulfatase activity
MVVGRRRKVGISRGEGAALGRALCGVYDMIGDIWEVRFEAR